MELILKQQNRTRAERIMRLICEIDWLRRSGGDANEIARLVRELHGYRAEYQREYFPIPYQCHVCRQEFIFDGGVTAGEIATVLEAHACKPTALVEVAA